MHIQRQLLGLCAFCSAIDAADIPFTYSEATIADLSAEMCEGKLTSHALTQAYLDRIAAIDKVGPAINAVIELNPDALAIANLLDAERKRGKVRGPLHGIPVLIKDNIDTADKMHTTAGSLALADSIAPKDSTVAAKLRAAGAVILGKTNLSEWANFRDLRGRNGWSGRGGQTKNPYVLDMSPSGSSSGTGAGISANLAVAGLGTETHGSIIAPALINGIVAIKPTVGLVSRAGIIPIANSQDTAGPMARTIADAAALLTAIAGTDPRDAATKEADKHRIDYTKVLDAHALKGKRIGIIEPKPPGPANEGKSVSVPNKLRGDNADAGFIAALKAAGAIIVDDFEFPVLNYWEDEMTILQYEFKSGINAYLAQLSPLIKTRTLADLIEFNKTHADSEMSLFGQGLFEESQSRGTLNDKEYKDALTRAKRLTGPEGIDAALTKYHLDALISGGALTGFVAAVAGYPSVTVPFEAINGIPSGVTFIGAAWSEPKLIAYAYAFEQVTHGRKPPLFIPHSQKGFLQSEPAK